MTFFTQPLTYIILDYVDQRTTSSIVLYGLNYTKEPEDELNVERIAGTLQGKFNMLWNNFVIDIHNYDPSKIYHDEYDIKKERQKSELMKKALKDLILFIYEK